MIWIAYILLDSLANWYWIEKKKSVPFYLLLFIIRGIAAILYGAFILNVQADFKSVNQWLAQTVLMFPFLFNTSLNTFRGKELDYLGANSGWIDSFMVKHDLQRLWFWVTFVLFVIAFKYFV